jgi:predicted N-acetyltransferase YhbS
MNIRKAEERDIPSIAKLSGALGYSPDETVVKSRFKEVNSDSSHAIFVAEDKPGYVVAWIHILPRILLISRPMAEIGGLIVDEKYRRQRIGRKLIDYAEHWAIENGYEGIIVRSYVARTESHSFYPAVGYNFLKEQRVYIKFTEKESSQ